jgi:hypothetical protein
MRAAITPFATASFPTATPAVISPSGMVNADERYRAYDVPFIVIAEIVAEFAWLKSVTRALVAEVVDATTSKYAVAPEYEEDAKRISSDDVAACDVCAHSNPSSMFIS